MSTPTKITAERFEEIKAVISSASVLMDAQTKASSSRLPYACKLGATLSPNSLWVKVFKFDQFQGQTEEEAGYGPNARRSAWAFIDAEGRVWKAASWTSAAKNSPRGTLKNLSDPEIIKAWQYGVR